jgi:hypothetical protein
MRASSLTQAPRVKSAQRALFHSPRTIDSQPENEPKQLLGDHRELYSSKQ